MMSPLALLNEGETGEIVAHSEAMGHAHNLCCGRCETCACRTLGHRTSDHISNMGLRPGKQVEMITNSGSGLVVLRVDECRIALGRGAAMKIYVRRNEG